MSTRFETGGLPTGTVTFAFTDIEGSTKRWERDREAMRDALRRHDAAMRAAIVACDGHVFKTIGDAFCVAFARAEDAIRAMLDAQLALAAGDFTAVDGLLVRIAIHTGTADERERDYFGPAVNRVARLLAIGHGGQVLVSGVTANLVRGDLPPHASLRDLGDHLLKDVARPERVYQLEAPGLARDFPALRSLDARPNNLPPTLTTFVGRERELADLTALLAKHRLVTLVGSGGIGKTRTSLQIAANLLDGTGDGAWFVELAPLANGAYIAQAAAQTMGLTLPADGDALAHLVRALHGKNALIVFDNCEHLVEAAAHAIAAISRGCPKIRILATSRQVLGVAGEAAYRMPSLVLPSGAEARELGAIAAMRFPAIALFVERASAASNTFELVDEHAPTLVEICRRLDGIPLAIELAAPRVKMLSLPQLRDRLDERFRVLTGGSRDVLPRQQTLRALIDWSHDLLEERERALLRRLAIFVDGFTLDGAAAVGCADDLDEIDLFDVLASLVDKSLVIAEACGSALRYRMLESTRFYAREKLAAANEEAATSARHLGYFRNRFVELHATQERTAIEAVVDDAFARELEDVRAALDVALETDVAVGAELLAALGEWSKLGLGAEGIARGERFLARLDVGEHATIAQIGFAIGDAYFNLGVMARSLEACERALEAARAGDERAKFAASLGIYARGLSFTGRIAEAEAAYEEVESIASASARTRLCALMSRGFHAMSIENFAEAVPIFERVAREQRKLGNVRGESMSRIGLAESQHGLGESSRALATIEELLPVLETMRDSSLAVIPLANAAAYAAAIDDLERCFRYVREALASTHDPEGTWLAMTLQHLALGVGLGGDLRSAAILGAFCDARVGVGGYFRDHTENRAKERLDGLLAALDTNERTRLQAEGTALAPDAAEALGRGLADAFVARSATA